MLDYTITIGLAPMRRNVTPRPGIFNWEKAEERGEKYVRLIEEGLADSHIRFVDLKGINSVDLMYCEEDADNVIARFMQEKVDAVFVINCNFGNEEIAGRVAETLGKPVLLWAPPDDVFEVDGTRYTDSQCGIFGVSKQLQRLNVPFTYLPNCEFGTPGWMEVWDRFIRAVCMVKNFAGMRIGQVGLRPAPFTSVVYNEGELMQKFGIRVIPINMAVVIDKFHRIEKEKSRELEQGAQILCDRYQMDEISREKAKQIYAFVYLYRELFEEYRLDVVASECWTSMQLGLEVMPCAAFSVLMDMGYIIACETDVHAALTMAMLSCATLGEKKPFLGEFTVRNPQQKDSELLWHCGPFAYSLKKQASQAKMVNMRQWFQVKDGCYTVARIDQEAGNYKMLSGTCRSCEGPYTFGTYLWAKFDDLDAWEKKLVEGPYIHHVSEIEGDVTGAIGEFCRYISGLEADWAVG